MRYNKAMQYIGIDFAGDWQIINEEDLFDEDTLKSLEHLILPYQGEKIRTDKYILERDIFLNPKKNGQRLAVYSVRRRVG